MNGLDRPNLDKIDAEMGRCGIAVPLADIGDATYWPLTNAGVPTRNFKNPPLRIN
ncbi:MAG: hypothetical protein ACRD6X_02870 [Pyrinomonadaceae bacterium]